jgi:hypothetical protein
MYIKKEIPLLSLFLFITFLLIPCQAENVIGVGELEYGGEISKNDALFFSDIIRHEVSHNAKYILIDSKLMSDILYARKISSYPPCSNKKKLRTLGQLLTADIMIGGKISRKSNELNFTLLAVDVNRNVILDRVDSVIITTKKEFISNYLPAYCTKLLISIGYRDNESTQNTKSFFKSPYCYIGIPILFISGGVTYTLMSKSSNKNNNGDISLDDAPIRSRP